MPSPAARIQYHFVNLFHLQSYFAFASSFIYWWRVLFIFKCHRFVDCSLICKETKNFLSFFSFKSSFRWIFIEKEAEKKFAESFIGDVENNTYLSEVSPCPLIIIFIYIVPCFQWFLGFFFFLYLHLPLSFVFRLSIVRIHCLRSISHLRITIYCQKCIIFSFFWFFILFSFNVWKTCCKPNCNLRAEIYSYCYATSHQLTNIFFMYLVDSRCTLYLARILKD